MNTIETAKKIKWMIQRIKSSISKNGFEVKFASLYREIDESEEIWESYIGTLDSFDSLILFIAIIKCEYFEIEIQIREKDGFIGLFKADENGDINYEKDQFETKKENDELIRLFLEFISNGLGINFSEVNLNNKEIAYTTLLKQLQRIDAA